MTHVPPTYTGIVVLIGSHQLPLHQRLFIEYSRDGETKRIQAPKGAQVGQRYKMTWHRHPGDWQLIPIGDKEG